MKPETREGIRYSLTVFLAVRLGLLVLGLVRSFLSTTARERA